VLGLQLGLPFSFASAVAEEKENQKTRLASRLGPQLPLVFLSSVLAVAGEKEKKKTRPLVLLAVLAGPRLSARIAVWGAPPAPLAARVPRVARFRWGPRVSRAPRLVFFVGLPLRFGSAAGGKVSTGVSAGVSVTFFPLRFGCVSTGSTSAIWYFEIRYENFTTAVDRWQRPQSSGRLVN